MAVIREQRQFKVGTIGVNRPSRAGVILAEGVADAASQVESVLFDINKDMAKQRGAEAAQQLAREDIVALDENGRPKAYKAPSILGQFEREAYNAVLMQRFESEIQLDMRNRSNELAIQFRRSPEAYKKAMADYVASTANSEESTVFTNYITTLGTGLANQQYKGLQLQAIERQEADDRQAYSNSLTNLYRDIEDTAAIGGDVDRLIQEGEDLDSIYVQSGTVLPSSVTGNKRAREIAKARGTLRFEIKKALENPQMTKEELAKALSAIDLNDPSKLPDSFVLTRNLLAGRGPTFAEEISNFGIEILNDAVVQKDLDNQRLIRERQASAFQTESELNASLGTLLKSPTSELIGELDDIISDFVLGQSTYQSEILRGVDPSVAASGVLESTQRMGIASQAITKKLMLGADSKEELINIQTYLKSQSQEDLNKLDPDAAVLAKGLIKISQVTGTDVLDVADTFAESISDETVFRESQRKLNNSSDIDQMLDKAESQAFQDSDVNLLEQTMGIAASEIKRAEIDEGDRKRFNSRLDNFIGANYFRLAFGEAKTERLISAMSSYVNRGVDEEGLLTNEQKELLDKGRQSFDDPSALRTSLGVYAGNAENDRQRRADIVSENKFKSDVLSGVMNGSDEKNRERLDKLFGVTPDFYIDPEFAKKNPNLEMALQQASATIWPQAQLRAIDSFLSGNITDEPQVERLLTTFAQASTFVTANGQSMRSKGSEAMSNEDYALMSELAAYAESGKSPALVLQHMNQLQTLQQNPTLQKEKQDFFTMKVKEGGKTVTVANSVAEYVLQNYKEARGNTNLRNRLIAVANATYFANLSDTKSGISDVKKVLDAEFNAHFVEDDMIVAEDGSSMTMYPLDMTTGGNTDLFVSYIRNEMVKGRVNDDIDYAKEDIKLVPVGFNSQDRGMTYGVVVVDKKTGERRMQDIRISPDPRDQDSEDFGVVPAFFSTNETAFARIKASINQAITDDELSEAQRRFDAMKKMGEGFAQISTAVVGPKTDTDEVGPKIINPLGGMTFMPTDTFMKEREEFLKSKKKKIESSQNIMKPFIDVEKYAPLFADLPSSIGVNYGKLDQASPTSIPRILREILDATENLDSRLAQELQADLLEMVRALQ